MEREEPDTALWRRPQAGGLQAGSAASRPGRRAGDPVPACHQQPADAAVAPTEAGGLKARNGRPAARTPTGGRGRWSAKSRIRRCGAESQAGGLQARSAVSRPGRRPGDPAPARQQQPAGAAMAQSEAGGLKAHNGRPAARTPTGGRGRWSAKSRNGSVAPNPRPEGCKPVRPYCGSL